MQIPGISSGNIGDGYSAATTASSLALTSFEYNATIHNKRWDSNENSYGLRGIRTLDQLLRRQPFYPS